MAEIIPKILFGTWFVVILVWGIHASINSSRLNTMSNKILTYPNNELVMSYNKILKHCTINNHPSEWQKIKNVFFAVYNSKEVSMENKKELYLLMLKKGVMLGNFVFHDEPQQTDEEKIRKSGEDGENRVMYALKWLPSDYKVIRNIKLNSTIETQEFDNIIIGKNGIFHIETKNFGGENGCKIKINEQGDWVRIDNDNETGVENPSFQLLRHDKVLKENINKYFGKDRFPIEGVIVLSNPKTILEGAENSDEKVIKAERLVNYITRSESEKVLTEEEINDIYEKLIFLRN